MYSFSSLHVQDTAIFAKLLFVEKTRMCLHTHTHELHSCGPVSVSIFVQFFLPVMCVILCHHHLFLQSIPSIYTSLGKTVHLCIVWANSILRVCVCVCVYLPSCNMQEKSYARTVPSPNLLLSSLLLKSWIFLALIISASSLCWFIQKNLIPYYWISL